ERNAVLAGDPDDRLHLLGAARHDHRRCVELVRLSVGVGITELKQRLAVGDYGALAERCGEISDRFVEGRGAYSGGNRHGYLHQLAVAPSWAGMAPRSSNRVPMPPSTTPPS